MSCGPALATFLWRQFNAFKNRKIKLLKTIYPHVNIQVFYRKDFQDLLGKYGIAGGA